MAGDPDRGPKPSKKRSRTPGVVPLINFFDRPTAMKCTEFSGKEILQVLRERFKLGEFRGQQEEIVKEVLNRKDCLVLMPTGSGKSITYQLPAVMSRGITLVVSPLLSLIQNQVMHLGSLGISAAAINCKTPLPLRRQIIADLVSFCPKFKLLYVTPELLAKTHTREILMEANSMHNIERLVVDEAHCISEWGHNFRADYRRLSWIRKELGVPVVALTATAKVEVREDISNQLGLEAGHKVFAVSPDRHNIFYEVLFKMPGVNHQHEIISILADIYDGKNQEIASSPFSAIIYCSTKAECDYLAQLMIEQNIKASTYHSDVPTKEREAALRNWLNNGTDNPEAIDVMIATVAFGMGIDKPSVRLVIHCDLPKSVEAYCQESGRAGRDGKLSRSIVFYSRRDRDRILWLLRNQKKSDKLIDNFKKMVEYCERTDSCRHKLISAYFDDSLDNLNPDTRCPNHNCDYCSGPEALKSRKLEYDNGTNPSCPLSFSTTWESNSCSINTNASDSELPRATAPTRVINASELYKKILDSRKRKKEKLAAENGVI